MPRPISTSWKPRLRWSTRSACRTTCRPRSVRARSPIDLKRPVAKAQGDEQGSSIGRHHRLLDGAFACGRVGDPLAHVAGAGTALGAGAAGPEHVGGAARTGAHGGVYFAFPDGPADTDIHGRFDPSARADATYSQAQHRGRPRPGQAAAKTLTTNAFPALSAALRRSHAGSCP